MNYTMRSAGWLLIYLFFIVAPLFALLLGAMPPARDFWTEFSVALGYAGLAIMGLQFGLTARFRYVTEPLGEDVIYHFHRRISLIAVGLVIAHPIILFVVRPELLALLNFIEAPWRAINLFADCVGGHRALARAIEYPLRNLASYSYHPGADRARGRDPAYDWLEFLSG